MLPKRSSRLFQKRRKRLIGRIALITTLVLVVIATPLIVLRLSFWRIDNIVVVGQEAIPEHAIRSVAEEKMKGLSFFLFPRNNILLYPAKHIKQSILETFPRVDDVAVSMTGLKEITLNISEREPFGVWCSEDNRCYFLDEHGLIFDRAPDFSNNVYNIFRGKVADSPVLSFFAPTEEFSTIKSFLEVLPKLSLIPKEVEALTRPEYAVLLESGEKILFSTAQSAEETLANLESVLSDPKLALFDGESLAVWSLDLRYGNKVFFVRKGEEVSP